MNRLRLTVACLVIAICSPLAFLQGALAEEVIRINGTGCGLVIAKPLIAAFRKTNPGVSFAMEKSLGSAASLKAIAKGALDIAIAGRALKPHEMVEGLSWAHYGKTPYAVVTYGHIRIREVTSAQLAAMYSGKLARWQNGDLVRVILRPKEDIDTRILRHISAEMDRAVTDAHARKDMLLGVTDQETFDYLVNTPGAVGFVPLAMPVSAPGTTNVSSLDGVEPTLANLAAGKYHYAKDIFVVTKKDASPAVQKFVQFMNSKKGRGIAVKSGLLPTVAK